MAAIAVAGAVLAGIASFAPPGKTQTGEEPAKPKPSSAGDAGITIKRVGVLFASPSDDPGVHAKVNGAKKTVLAAAYEWEYGVRLFSPAKWKEQSYEWNAYLRNASREADRLVEKIEPIIHRDSRGVIDYAELTSEDPFLSSVLLSRKLIPKFERDFGPRLYAIVLDRYRIFLFPADGGKLEAYGTALADAYRETDRPVSLEVFLIDANGALVIGEIGE